MSERPTARQALDKIRSHEEQCVERYNGIRSDIGDLKKEMSDQRKAAWGVVLALVAWLALQVYDGLKDREPPHYGAQAATVEARR